MTKHYEPVFLDADGRRCGERLPYDKGEVLPFKTPDGDIVQRIRRGIDANKANDRPAFWVDFL